MTMCPDNVRPVILIGHVNKPLEKNLLIPLLFKRTSIFFHFMFLLVRLIRLSCYRDIFHILTSQKKEVTELKFLQPDNTTRNNCKFSLIPASGLSSFNHSPPNRLCEYRFFAYCTGNSQLWNFAGFQFWSEAKFLLLHNHAWGLVTQLAAHGWNFLLVLWYNYSITS